MIAPLLLAFLLNIHPSAPQTGNVVAVAKAVDFVTSHDALPTGWSRNYTIATMLVYAWHESRFVMHSQHKDGETQTTYCAFQVANRPELENDPVGCARAALAVMRASVAKCGDLSGYVGSCGGAAAMRMAKRRQDEAERVLWGF